MSKADRVRVLANDFSDVESLLRNGIEWGCRLGD